jgi:hypothetical protein
MEFAVGNKPGRVEKIRALVTDALQRSFGLKDAASIRGLLQYAEGYTHAKLGAPALRALTEVMKNSDYGPPSEHLKVSLMGAVDHLCTAGPRKVRRQLDPPVIIFTDGACEAECTSIGGVIFDGQEIECFGAEIPQPIVDSWKSTIDQLQVIGQAELFPLLIARLTWKDRLVNRRAIYFVDNDSARQAAIRCYSPVLSSLEIIIDLVGFDYKEGSWPWYSRVPTEANVADAPSRMQYSGLVKDRGAKIVRPVFPVKLAPVFLKSGRFLGLGQ